MADALVERRPTARFFCHRCNIEFEDVLQDYTCPYCASGFIEQLETEADVALSGDDFSDADMSNLDDVSNLDDMSNLDDSDDFHQSTPPMLNDLAFLMSGGRLRGAGRRETLMEQLVWMIGGARGGGGAVAAGAPFVLVGAPGDYVFGGEGLDAVVTQLLGQLENAGPPPLPREQIAALPSEEVSAEQAAANTSCSVCWENFQQGESVSRLECDHIFHSACISPWLQLHATCPICRRSLLTEEQLNEASQPPAHEESFTTTSLPGVRLLRRIPRRRALAAAAQTLIRTAGDTSSSSSMSTTSSVTATTAAGAGAGAESTAEAWAAPLSATNSTGSTSSSSLNSSDRDRHNNMDMEFD